MNKAIQNYFALVPKTYEKVNHILTLGLDAFWRKRAARIAAKDGGAVWMDVCTGTGETAVYLKRLSPEGTLIVAADFSMPMLSVAAKKRDAKGMLFTIADASLLPFRDGSFDLITISFATRNLNTSREHMVRCFREFHRLLKDGGRFVNLETSRPSSAVIRKIFHFFVGSVVARVGRLVSGAGSPYIYLSQTIPRFYGADELSDIMKEAGFSEVSFERVFFGAAAIHKAIK